MQKRISIALFCAAQSSMALAQQDDAAIADLVAAGAAIYTQPGACITCHMPDAGGNPSLNSKSLRFGPTPLDLSNALNSVPQMGPIAVTLNLTNDDLLALSVYLHDLAGLELNPSVVAGLRETTAGISTQRRDRHFVVTQRDRIIDQYGPFQSVLDTWVRKSQTGNIKKTYQTRVTNTWPTDDPAFTPVPGRTCGTGCTRAP